MQSKDKEEKIALTESNLLKQLLSSSSSETSTEEELVGSRGSLLSSSRKLEVAEQMRVWDERLRSAGDDLRANITLSTKQKALKTYSKVFRGEAAVKLLLEKGHASAEEEALSLMDGLLKKTVIVPIKNKKKAKKKFKARRFYWFAEDSLVLSNVRLAESGDFALVADESVLDSVIGKKKTTEKGPSLIGAAQSTVVDAVCIEPIFAQYYYTDDGREVNLDELIWQNKKERSLKERLELTDVNVLHKGDFSKIPPDGKRYLICVNGTEASTRAFNEAIKKVRPEKDFVFLLAVRERHMPDHLSMQAKDRENRVAWEFNLWLTVRHLMAPLRKELLERKIDFMILGPRAFDGRKKICEVAKQYRVHVIAIGKHAKKEQGQINATQKYFRGYARYITKHKPDSTEIWIF